MADVASYCTYCGAKIEPSSKFCSNCGKATSIAAAQEKTASAAGGEGGGIVKDVGGGRVAGIAEKRASAAWYLLPIFLWFIGGLIMFFVLKDEDRGRAKGGLKLGIILSVIGFVLWMLILAAIAATAPATSSFYYP
jgi:zinc-ribbon domain